MDEIWREPARDLPVIGRPDVLVVGAGSAGIAAALAAARRGADTWLIERGSWIGGLATFGLINLLLTLDDGAGTQVVAGLCQEVVDRLDAFGAARCPTKAEWNVDDPAVVDHWRRWGLVWGAPPEAVRYSVAFDPEAFVEVSYRALQEAGVRLRLHTWCAAVYGDGRVDRVVLESKAGRQVVQPRVVVDATGDGDVVVAAGATVEHVQIPPYLWFRVTGVRDPESAANAFLFRTTGSDRMLVPWGPLGRRVDPCDPDDMTAAELECRAEAWRVFESLRRDNPAFADASVSDFARMLGITESRRLQGDYVLQKEDGDVAFADSIACTGHWTKRHVTYDIPYRCLTTPAAANVLTAGRCISTTRYVHQATKEIPAAMATGEAAGAAAAHAVRAASVADADVRTVDVDALRRDLRDAGAIVTAPGR